MSPVSLTVEDVTTSFAPVAEAFARASTSERQRLWAGYEDRNRDLFDLYYSDWARREDAAVMLPRLAVETPLIEEHTTRLRALVPRLAETTAATLGQHSVKLHFVFFVGVYASNAWVTSYRQQPTAFFCVEQLPYTPYDEILIAHETAHAVHQLRRQGDWRETAVLHRLFEEGLATLSSTVVKPDHSDGEYLWVAPDFDGWVRDCEAAWPAIRDHVLAAASDSRTSMKALFHTNNGNSGLPKRCGYYGGLKVLRKLTDQYRVGEMIAWSADRASEEVRGALSSTS
jgi:hypothetical protein